MERLTRLSLNTSQLIFKGIELATGSTTFTLDQAIPGFGSSFKQEVNSLRIDLQNPHVQFFSTPSNGVLPLETNAQTTSQFLDEYD